MKTRLLLAVLWFQVALAAISLGLLLYSQLTRPAMQIEYSRSTGVVSSVFKGGAADRAGIRATALLESGATAPSPTTATHWCLRAAPRLRW